MGSLCFDFSVVECSIRFFPTSNIYIIYIYIYIYINIIIFDDGVTVTYLHATILSEEGVTAYV